MAMTPILLESTTISKDFKPLQDLAIKQPSEVEMVETLPFQQLVEAPSETPAFAEGEEQTSADAQQDLSFQDTALKDNLAEALHDSEEEPLEAFFAFCSVPSEYMKSTMEAAEVEANQGQKPVKKNLAEDFSMSENVSSLKAASPETDVNTKGLGLTSEELSFFKNSEGLKATELQNFQAQKMEMLSQKQLSDIQEETHAVAEAVPFGANETFLMGALEQEKSETEPAVMPLLVGEGSQKITYYAETTNRLNSRTMVSQIVDQIPYEALKTEGQQHFKLQIHPKELGEVQVHLVVMEQGKLQATFSGSPYTMDLLQQGSDLLCESLKKEGFDALSENFSFTSDQSFQRGFEREAFATPTLHPLGQSAQQDAIQLDRLESSMRQLFQHQGSGLSVSLNV
ncbi:MAG: flagellar hook-length control protein FliK [Alphaproteobacteria bacterium]